MVRERPHLNIKESNRLREAYALVQPPAEHQEMFRDHFTFAVSNVAAYANGGGGISGISFTSGAKIDWNDAPQRRTTPTKDQRKKAQTFLATVKKAERLAGQLNLLNFATPELGISKTIIEGAQFIVNAQRTRTKRTADPKRLAAFDAVRMWKLYSPKPLDKWAIERLAQLLLGKKADLRRYVREELVRSKKSPPLDPPKFRKKAGTK